MRSKYTRSGIGAGDTTLYGVILKLQTSLPFLRILKFVLSPDPVTCAISKTSIAYVPVSDTVNRAVFSVNVIPLPAFVVPPVDPVNAS